MLNVWTAVSGTSLGDISERQVVNLTLPTTGSLDGITFKVISGALPAGLRIEGNKILGTTFEVKSTTTSSFVIRATDGISVSDRTFVMTVEGPDAPQWVTPEGKLTVNPNGLAFVLDNSYIDFQLQAIDRDLPAGDSLEFFIESGNGELPPGLSLSPSGKITGIIDPIISLDVSAGTGFFDTNLFDSNSYDFGEAPKTGLDSFLYDSYVYDYYDLVRTPRKLNRNYEFIVTVTDGETPVQRKFRIFVVGDDFLRADNAIMQVGTGTFTADNTYLRAPIWITPNNLGVKRANNFVTIFLDAYDPMPTIGPLYFELSSVNDDLSESVLPPGLALDPTNGELFGLIPYQPAITREYKFTINAVKYDAQSYTEKEVVILTLENAAYGQNFLRISPLPEADVNLLLNESVRIGMSYYKVIGYEAPIGTSEIATLNLQQSLMSDIPAETEITKIFIESTVQFNTVKSPKTFVISVLGEVDSVIQWITDFNLGNVRANFPSLLSVKAQTSVPNAVLTYRLVGGSLPPGLSFASTGEIIGEVRQFGTTSLPGLLTFDNSTTTFDGGGTTFDREFTFTVLAEDQFKYSGILGTFTLTVYTPDDRLYSNIYVRPYQKPEKRSLFYDFINDSSIFSPNKIYRLTDSQFGIQQDLKMLIYAGIETLEANKYISALTTNTKRKRFRLGSPRTAIAKKQGSNEIEYEVIYLEVFDEYEIGTLSASQKLKLPTNTSSKVLVNQTKLNPIDGNLGTYNPNNKTVTYQSTLVETRLNNDSVDRFIPQTTPITVDSRAVKISGSDLEYVYPSSVTNMRNNIKNIMLESGRNIYTESEFLPLWMVTPQNSRTAATGYVKAIPLCYCKPGESTYILENINNSGFDFTQIDYEIDRYIIDSTTGNNAESYLKFSNYKYNV